MLYSQLTAMALLAGIASAVPAPNTHVLHEKRHAPDSLWSKAARVDGKTYLPMRIALTQTNLEKGDDFLLEV